MSTYIIVYLHYCLPILLSTYMITIHDYDTNIPAGVVHATLPLTIVTVTAGFVDRDASVAEVVATQQDAGDLRWAELERDMTRPLRINGMDFTDLKEFDDINLLKTQKLNSGQVCPCSRFLPCPYQCNLII